MKLVLTAMILGTALTALSAYADEVVTVVASPKTAADHVKIADSLTQNAIALESEADWHDKMRRLPYGLTFPKSGPNQTAHCQALRDKLTAQAKEARAGALAEYKLAALADR